MTMMTRRRFVGSVLAIVGAAGAGLTTWLVRGEEATAAPTTTTKGPLGGEPNSNRVEGEAATTTSTSGPVPPEPDSNLVEAEATTTTTVAPAEGIAVICKEAWGALPVAGEFLYHEIGQITVHHTAVVLESNADAPGRVRQHQQFHQSRGWPDIAYHFIIDAAGNVYEGRPIDTVGDTGTDYDPTGHLLICCEGEFNQQEVTARQYASLVQMVAWGAAEFEVDPDTVRGHRDLAATSCPGDNLYTKIADGSFAADVASAAVGEIRPLCGADGESLVAAIEMGTN